MVFSIIHLKKCINFYTSLKYILKILYNSNYILTIDISFFKQTYHFHIETDNEADPSNISNILNL